MNHEPNRICALNDELRRNLLKGHAVITLGVAALGADAVACIIKTIAVYDDFCHELGAEVRFQLMVASLYAGDPSASPVKNIRLVTVAT